MIPRYQRVLFWTLAAAIVLMAAFMLHGCAQAREKLTRHRDETPLAAPVASANETIRLAIANDGDGSISLSTRDIALPAEETARVRAVLVRLLAEYSYKNSTHPIESGPSVDDVFLLDLPLRASVSANSRTAGPQNEEAAQPSAGGQLAVVNLHGTFADHHPSGIEPETLTIQSILGTLYANFPRIQQVRFLVDGRPRETLSGHADLLRDYLVTDTGNKSAPSNTKAER